MQASLYSFTVPDKKQALTRPLNQAETSASKEVPEVWSPQGSKTQQCALPEVFQSLCQETEKEGSQKDAGIFA